MLPIKISLSSVRLWRELKDPKEPKRNGCYLETHPISRNRRVYGGYLFDFGFTFVDGVKDASRSCTELVTIF